MPDTRALAMCLKGKKLLVALTLEGRSAGDLLQSIDEHGDMRPAVARELVERDGTGDSARRSLESF